MQLTEIPIVLTLKPPKTPRSVGIHVSGIIRAIATERGILKPEWAEEISLADVRTITDQTAILRISIGLAWEEHYISTHLEELGVLDHPGELQVDGVYMTHDAESLDDITDVIITDRRRFEVIVHEIKATYKSVNTVGGLTGQSNWMWIAQCLAYCKAVGTRFAKLHALFLCGDYTWPIKPKLKCWLIEFTQEEVDTNWDLLHSYMLERLAIEGEK